MATFSVTGADGEARAGRLATAHGEVETPCFMPVGTRGSVKAMAPHELVELGAQVILGNTYHLFLRPGTDVIRAAGGLHRFIGWERPMLTDSGGYQVFSLAKLRKVTRQGIAFRNHLDGAMLFLGPKEAMAIQRDLAADIAMVLDECPPHPSTEAEAAASLKLTLEWAAICRDQPRAPGQLVFGIVQGSAFPELRKQAARALREIGFDGYAVGGVSVGEPEESMYRVLDWTVPELPPDQPRYLMGVGTPPQLVEGVARGIDLFDCVLPTRVGRNGSAFTATGMMQIKAGRFKDDFGPLEEGCACYACQHFSRAYIRHLVNVGEILGLRLVTLHNLHYYLTLMRTMRAHILAGTFAEFRRDFHARYVPPARPPNGNPEEPRSCAK